MSIRFVARAPSYQTSLPHRIEPESGVSSPAIKRSTVVFPAPDGPNRTVTACVANGRHSVAAISGEKYPWSSATARIARTSSVPAADLVT